MVKNRDMQRKKLYRAEDMAEKSKPGVALKTIPEIERYLKRQAKRKTLVSRYGSAVDLERWDLKISDGRGTRIARGGISSLNLPGWARKEWIVLHEWAHMIHKRLGHSSNGTRSLELRGGAAHGWQYAAIFLDLVQFCMGKEYADELKAQYKANKVRFRKPRVSTRKGIKPTFGKPVVEPTPVTDYTAQQAVEGYL